MTRLPADFFINAALSLAGILLLVLISDYPRQARLFPQLVLIIVTSLTVLDLIRRLKTVLKNKPPDDSKDPENDAHPQQRRRFFLTVGLMVVFLYAILFFGFVPGSFVFIFISAWALGYRDLKFLTLFSVIITAFMYIVFILVMDSFFSPSILSELLGG